MFSNTARYLLLVLSAFGFVCLYGFSAVNGFFEACRDLNDSKTFYDGLSYKNVFTRIKPLDELFSFLLTFFWPLCDGKHPALTLHSILFAGQFVAAWTVTMMEGVRVGNAWRFSSMYVLHSLLCRIVTDMRIRTAQSLYSDFSFRASALVSQSL